MVQQDIYLAALCLRLRTPLLPNWRLEEKQFFTPSLPAAMTVPVELEFADPLPVPAGNPVYRGTSMTVYSGQDEERLYTPTFLADRAPYALSRRDGNGVHVFQRRDPNLWNNPNYYPLTLMHIEDLLLDAEGLILHTCYTEYQGGAILFTAPSGTGKTTQAELWKKCYGSTIVNGDKCILQRTPEGWRACGFFLHGSAPECENRSLPIRAIVVVRQSPRDHVEEIPAAQKLGLLYSECTVNNWDPAQVQTALSLLSDLVSRVPVVLLHCTMEDSAAQVLHQHLFGGYNGTF